MPYVKFFYVSLFAYFLIDYENWKAYFKTIEFLTD